MINDSEERIDRETLRQSYIELKQTGLDGYISCLELTAASPSLSVHHSQSVSSRAQHSSLQAGLSLPSPVRTIDEIELS